MQYPFDDEEELNKDPSMQMAAPQVVAPRAMDPALEAYLKEARARRAQVEAQANEIGTTRLGRLGTGLGAAIAGRDSAAALAALDQRDAQDRRDFLASADAADAREARIIENREKIKAALLGQEKNQALRDKLFNLSEQGKNQRASIVAGSQKDKSEKDAEKNIFNQTEGLRKEINSLPTTKDTQSVSAAYERIKQAQENPSPAGDLALIFNYMKMLDPGSTVREGEFANAQNATGVPSRILNQYNKVISGERLNPEQRKDFYSQAGRQFSAQLAVQNRVIDQYKNIARKRNLPEDEITLNFGKPVEDFKQPKTVQSDFPRKIFKDGKSATVSNAKELAEAQAEGWN